MSVRCALAGALALLAVAVAILWAPQSAHADTHATGRISPVPANDLADGEWFMIGDGSNPPTFFEFNFNTSVEPGRVPVSLTAGQSVEQVRDSIITAVNGVGAGLEVTAFSNGGATVDLVNDNPGAMGNESINENVADPTFFVEGMSGGNRSPIFDPIGNKTVNEGEQLQFTVSATDPDGGGLTYAATSLPPGASFDSTSRTFTWTPDFNQAGTYSGVEFSASDTESESSSTITITVADVNRPPVLTTIGNKAASEGSLLQFAITASDPDGGTRTYSASSLPPGATFDPASGTFTWTPAYNQAGNYPNVQFQVSDGNSIDSETITITVANVPTPSKTSLSVTKKPRSLRASGKVTPSQPGRQVIVRLFRKRAGKFRLVATRRPVITTVGEYRTQFRRPQPGRCRIVARFAGSTEARGSSASKTFRC